MKAEVSEDIKAVWKLLEQVPDPEVPVLSVIDLGVVRKVEFDKNKAYTITITPTYSGCPAMQVIEEDIRKLMGENNLELNEIVTTLTPPWTTDWLSEEGKKKLQAYGIAPPEDETEDKSALFPEPKKITCPRCKSRNTVLVSQFGSTACKALHKCLDCLEPFDYFKCL